MDAILLMLSISLKTGLHIEINFYLEYTKTANATTNQWDVVIDVSWIRSLGNMQWKYVFWEKNIEFITTNVFNNAFPQELFIEVQRSLNFNGWVFIFKTLQKLLLRTPPDLVNWNWRTVTLIVSLPSVSTSWTSNGPYC